MPRWLKHFLFVLMLVLFAGCAGSCSGCSGCGVTPLPGGFPSNKRVENASSVRLTQSGLSFLSQNLGPLAGKLTGSGAGSNGTITFNVPPSHTTTKVLFVKVNIDVCKNGPKPNAIPKECIVEIGLGQAKLNITTSAPHEIKVNGTLPVRLQRAPISTSIGSMCASLDNGGKFAQIPINVDVSMETDLDPTHASRKGYTKVKINTLTVDKKALESNLHFGCGVLGKITNFLKSFIAGQLISPLTQSLKSSVEKQLCTKENPAKGVTCPSGTYPDSGGTCRYCSPNAQKKCADSSAECVGMALGTDGNINLESALSSISPGTKGGFDFLAALGGEGARDNDASMTWGDLDPVNGGATFGMLGGVEPTPITKCVPLATLTRPTGIPIPDEIRANTVSGWTGPGPHFGLAVSERYLNYLLGSVYNSGALCIGIGADTLGSSLNSDMLSLLIPSLKDLGRQKKKEPLALMLRPQSPPEVQIGNGTDLAKDPLLKITMKKLTIDFYMWSSDRYIRAFSASFDVVIPVNLDVNDKSQLSPVIDKLDVQNPKLFNAPLLREDEKAAASALAGIIASEVGKSLGGSIKPIDLSSQLASLGLQLKIPPTVKGKGSPGLRLLTKGSDNFLGIFAAFATAPGPTAPLLRSQTTVELVSEKVEAAGLVLSTITPDNRPEVEIRVSSSLDTGAQSIEYQYRLDGGFWHEWTDSRYLTINSPLLSLQARHLVEVRSRVVGQPTTVDRDPAKLEVLIDKSAPDIELARRLTDGALGIQVHDVVSPTSAIRVRWAFDNDSFGDWKTADQLSSIDVGQASRIRVEARDEEGNIGHKQQALIRGRQDPALTAASSCGCRVPGHSAPGGMRYGLGAILALGLLFGLRRRGRRDDNDDDPRPPSPPGGPGSVRTLRVMASLGVMVIAASWSGCSCGSNGKANKGSGGSGGSGGGPGCPTCEQILPGLVGSYSSAAVASDGSVWVAGYDDIGYTQASGADPVQLLFGDLVVGKWDGQKVSWQSVDGLPAVDPTLDPGTSGGPPDPTLDDPNGFRQGLTDPGDDVGLWTSIALDSSGNPAVAYYDATHRALKFAHYDGTTWSSHTVESDDHGDIGRYAKLLMVGGKPVIAYLAIKQGKTPGSAMSSVRVATANSATPASASDWSFADAAVAASVPCRNFTCSTGELCRLDTGVCEKPASDCKPTCSSGECFDSGGSPTCVATMVANAQESYPEADGLYISMARTPAGLGIVYYDRVHGNLYGVSQSGGKWQPPVLLDGQGKDSQGKAVDTGDVGIGASLFVDGNGDWHVSYVDGFNESMDYLKVTGGTKPGTHEVIDSGATPNGQAVVGDDSAIAVTGSGEVHVAYQDATNGQLRWAVGVPKAAGGGHKWTATSLTVDGFAGAFNHILNVNGVTQVMTWWRKGKPITEGDVTLVAP